MIYEAINFGKPRGVLNTGHEGGERTAKIDVWI